MARITVELDDTLDERVDDAISEVKNLVADYVKENEKRPKWLSDLDDDGSVSGIIDGCVPIYTREIATAWFLHGDALESAYDDAGIGDNPRENYGMTAIYCYIEQQVNHWFQNESEAEE